MLFWFGCFLSLSSVGALHYPIERGWAGSWPACTPGKVRRVLGTHHQYPPLESEMPVVAGTTLELVQVVPCHLRVLPRKRKPLRLCTSKQWGLACLVGSGSFWHATPLVVVRHTLAPSGCLCTTSPRLLLGSDLQDSSLSSQPPPIPADEHLRLGRAGQWHLPSVQVSFRYSPWTSSALFKGSEARPLFWLVFPPVRGLPRMWKLSLFDSFLSRGTGPIPIPFSLFECICGKRWAPCPTPLPSWSSLQALFLLRQPILKLESHNEVCPMSVSIRTHQSRLCNIWI